MQQHGEQQNVINFMSLRWGFLLLSFALITLSIVFWFKSGNNKYGVDFLGGTEVVVQFDSNVSIGDLRKTVKDAGISGAVVQAFEGGNRDFSVRVKGEKSDDIANKIRASLADIKDRTFTLLKQDFVGPIIGEQIRIDGIKALILAILGILAYITIRFELRFAFGAIAALVHDVIITTGLFIFSGKEISAGVLAALLTIIGYSLNDTIIVFDRVRENLIEKRKEKKDSRSKIETASTSSLANLINLSITQTISRTILTSLTTLFVVTTLWLFGGGAVTDLAFALVIGVIVGTYSSIFIACTVILALEKP